MAGDLRSHELRPGDRVEHVRTQRTGVVKLIQTIDGKKRIVWREDNGLLHNMSPVAVSYCPPADVIAEAGEELKQAHYAKRLREVD